VICSFSVNCATHILRITYLHIKIITMAKIFMESKVFLNVLTPSVSLSFSTVLIVISDLPWNARTFVSAVNNSVFNDYSVQC
jgi:hypothetical protein